MLVFQIRKYFFMKKWSLLIFLHFAGIHLIAQNIITGTITDYIGEKIEFANILLLNEADSSFFKGAVSDLEGSFEILNIKPNRYFLLVTMVGYQEYTSFSFECDDHSTLSPFQITLQETTNNLEEITVTAKKPLFKQLIDRTIVNVQKSITAAGTSVLEMLEKSPGIYIDRINNRIAMQGKQGVIVMLNGKRMRMEEAALLQLLQSMLSDNIEIIELITTPPASFDAEGNAGVINIVTIKKEDIGVNGNVTLNGAYGYRGKFGGSFNLNFRNKRFYLFTNFSANHNYEESFVSIYRKNIFGNHITTNDIVSVRPALTKFYNGRIGADFEISKPTIVGVLFSGYFRHWIMNANTTTNLKSNVNGMLTNELQINENNKWEHWMVNVNLRHTFPKAGKLSLDLDYLDYFDDNPVNYLEADFDNDGNLFSQNRFASTKETLVNFKVGRLDYEKKWSDIFSLQAGIKGTISSFTNDLSLAQKENGVPVFDTRFTDASALNEKIGAVYFSTDWQIIPAITAKAGLRYEYYDSELNSRNHGNIVTQKFGRIYPSLYFTIQPNDHHQIGLSYAERINRPAFNNLAPTFFFWGYNTVFSGNPKVKPTISRQISASYRYKSVLFNMEFTDQNDPLTFQPEIIAEENLFIVNAANMQDAKSAMFSVNAPRQITKWWESRYNLAAYWIKVQPIYEGEVITEKAVYFNGNISQNFSLPKDFGIELTANFFSARSRGLGSTPFRGSLNLGLQKSFLSNWKISLNWNDLFNWGSFWAVDFDQPDLDIFYNWKYDIAGNVLRLSVSWQFGNTKLKKAMNRQTGSEEERGRMN